MYNKKEVMCMRKEEIWSVPIRRVRDFWGAQPDVLTEADDRWKFRSCRILLEELPSRGAGMWAAPRVRICMEGEESDVLHIHRRFFLQFLSAGG